MLLRLVWTFSKSNIFQLWPWITTCACIISYKINNKYRKGLDFVPAWCTKIILWLDLPTMHYPNFESYFGVEQPKFNLTSYLASLCEMLLTQRRPRGPPLPIKKDYFKLNLLASVRWVITIYSPSFTLFDRNPPLRLHLTSRGCLLIPMLIVHTRIQMHLHTKWQITKKFVFKLSIIKK
jgi:hypothetical protein